MLNKNKAGFHLSHPLKFIRKILHYVNKYIYIVTYYLIGATIGRLLYPSAMFKSKWFEKPTSNGWMWVTRGVFSQKLLRKNGHVPWPVVPYMNITRPHNISFDYDDLNNFQMVGCYFQAFGKITIGKGTYIAQNVGMITSNHDPKDLDAHLPAKDIVIGQQCWIGMNSVILPGVTLGPQTVVGAGSVVTKSFPEGHCVIAGNPATVIKRNLCNAK